MPYWLVEGDLTLYAILAAVGLVCVAVWWRTRRRTYAIGAVAVAVAILAFLLLDHFVESEREQMIRKVQEIAHAISHRRLDRAFEHVSEQFDRRGKNKQGFREFAEAHLRRGFVTDVQVWDFTVTEVSAETRLGVVECFFKVRGNFPGGESPPGAFTRIVFTLDPDKQWRVRSFDWFSSISDSKSPQPIPGW
jgi:hypothetical protein